jgi:hypothetical protein
MTENYGTSAPPARALTQAPRAGVARWTGILLLCEAISFGFASYLHLDGRIPLGFTTITGEQFRGAAYPEALIGLVLALAAGAVLAGAARARAIAITATVFAFLVTGYGLTVVLRGSHPAGDVVYHSVILIALAATFVVLLVRALSEPAPGS